MDQAALANIPDRCKVGYSLMHANDSFMGRPQEERNQIIENTLKRALNDERLADIAKDYGLARTTLNYNLIKLAGDDWKSVQTARAITAKEKAVEALDCASDALSLARAREQVKAAQWELEKLFRRWYGNEVNINLTHQVISIADALADAERRLSGRVIDAEQQSQCSMDSSEDQAQQT